MKNLKKISELEAKLKSRDEKIASLEKIEDKYEKLKGIDKPNCDIAKDNDLFELKITLKKGEVFDIEKLWPSKLDSEFNLVPGLNELIGTNISLEQVKRFNLNLKNGQNIKIVDSECVKIKHRFKT